ncbi:uncharacterized protein LOC103574161 [Microplitis demolitor]|uniref:uncharacterized protein LOC103574161 n=1 Tax=Microplitis demolitor TaxID=69319 RepID=UPI0006D5163F|nr:uncharacterized protein LOC103574161 [Microplitis demolitor]
MTCDDNALEVLQLLWKMDLLESFYVCPQPAHTNNTKQLLYTYNPFTNWAPQSWQEVVNLKNKPDDRWTLYQQSHRNDKIICDTLTFDKTKFLEGYGIKVTGFPVKNSNWTYNKNYSVDSIEYYFPHTYAAFFSTLFSALNVTPIINYDDNGVFIKNKVIGFLESLVNGTQDICMNNRYISDTVNNSVDSIKLHHQNGFLIITQPRDFISAFDKISDFFDTKIVIFSVFVLLFTFIIIILNNKRQQYCVAALDILRLILSNAMKAQLKRPSMRITFVIASILIFILTPSLQGQISSFLTKPERHNIENLNDLFDFKYHVHFHPILQKDIINQKLWLNSDEKYLHPITGYRNIECYEHVLNDTNAACITYSLAQVIAASEHHFHISNKLLFKTYFSFWTRKNWALKNKLDQIAFKIRQSGLYDYWYKNELYDPLKKLIIIESGDTFVKYSQIDIGNLKFAFLFLAIGLGFSLTIFGFEIML